MKSARFALGTILAVMCTLFVGSSSIQLFAQGGTWVTKAPMPTARFGLGTASVNGVIYAIGGGVSVYACVATGANEAYNPATNTWTTMAPMPTPRWSLGVAALNGIIYVVGGSEGCYPPSTVVEAYDPSTNLWSEKAPFPTSPNGFGVTTPQIGVINGILYVAGGQDTVGPYFSTLYAYDPVANTWSTKAAMPDARASGAGAVVNGSLYVVGGYSLSGFATSTFAYDPTSNTWSTKAPMSDRRSDLAAATVNNDIYAMGDGDATTNFLNTMEAYDPAADTWTTLASMPTPRAGLGADQVNGTIYAIGGLVSGYAETSTVEAFTPTTSQNQPPAATTTAISAPTVSYGSYGLVTVTVTSNAGIPTGTVSLSVDGGPPITQTLDASGSFTFTLTGLTVGIHNLAASYLPTGNFAASSATGTLTVNPVAVTVNTITVTPANPTINVGQTQQFTATGTFSDGTAHVLNLEWSSLAPMSTARTSLQGAAANGILYAIGGENGRDTPIVEAYNPASNVWSTVAPLNQPNYGGDTGRYLGSAVTVNGKVYMMGGWTNSPPLPSNTLSIYDPGTNVWSAGPTIPGSGYTACSEAGVIGSKIYLLNACNGFSYPAYVQQLSIFDTVANSWTIGPNAPRNHNAGLGAVLNGKFYVAGGNDGTAQPQVDVYDPSTGQWTTVGSMPVNLWSMAGDVINGKWYIVGGANATSNYNNTVWIYDPVVNTWTSGPPAPTARSGAAAATINGKLYVVGGSNSTGLLNALEVFDPNASGAAWSSDNAAVARIDPSGLATGLTPGTTTITATSGGISGSTVLTVVSPLAATTTVISAPSVSYGSYGLVTVTVTSNAGIPTGNVSLTVDGGTAITRTLDASGSFTFTLSGLTVGNHTLAASYLPTGNFVVSTATGTLTVNQATATVTLSNLTQTYTGSPLSPTVATTPSGLSFSLSGAPDTNAGSYPVTATVTDPNYTGSASGTFVINKAAATVTLSNLTQTYTGNVLTPTATTTPAGLTINLTGAPDTNAGSYPVTATVNDPNYQGSASGTFTINKATPTITWGNPADIIFGEALTGIQLNATASFNGSPLPGIFTYLPPAGTILPAGVGQTLSVSFAPTDASDFNNASASVVITVQPASQAIQSLTGLVASLNLAQGINNSLDAKLQNVLAALTAANAGQRQNAANQLMAFINAVQAQSGNQLTTAQANTLIAAAMRILAVI
jgi:N-acetylneuraminic acid mutarotase